MPFGGEQVGGLHGVVGHGAVGDDGEVVAGAAQRRPPQGHPVRPGRDRPLRQAVELLRLQEEHGVGILDRRPQQALGVGRGGGDHHLQPGHVGVEALDRLAVVERPVDPPAVGDPDHQRARPASARAVVEAGGLGDDLVEGGVDEVGELDLGDGPGPGHGHADGGADDQRLGQRGVEAALRPVGVGEAHRGLEHPALGVGDVLAEHQGLGMVGHDLVERLVDRGDQVDLDAGGSGLQGLGGLQVAQRAGVHHGQGVGGVGGRFGGGHGGRHRGARLLLDGLFVGLGRAGGSPPGTGGGGRSGRAAATPRPPRPSGTGGRRRRRCGRSSGRCGPRGTWGPLRPGPARRPRDTAP